MATQYALPASQTPLPRSRPLNTTGNSRESNALRASVLDAAMELGIGNNSVVAAWMFNNTLQEEDEEEEPVASPGLTHSSSTASEDGASSQYPTTPPNYGVSSRAFPNSGKPAWNHSYPGAPDMLGPRQQSPQPSAASVGVAFPTFDSIPIPPRPTTPTSRKLKKKGKDGNESDGGYISENAKALKKKESKARLKEEKREQKEEERKRKKSLGSNAKSSKKGDESLGFDTDGGAIASSSKSPFKKAKDKKSKDNSIDAGAGDDIDPGYVSAGSNVKKSKSRFFKLSLKSSRGDLKAQAVPELPPMPKEQPKEPKESMSLPIAGRFATSLGDTPPSLANSPTETPFDAPQSFLTPSNPVIQPFVLSDPKLQLPSIAAHQPMSFDDVVPSQRPPPPSVSTPSSFPPIDRSSLSSAESSTSSQNRRRGLQFSPRDIYSGHNHTAGAGSVSTFNSYNAAAPSISTFTSHSAATPSISTINSSSHGSAGHSGLTSPSTYQQPISPIKSANSNRPSSPSSSGPTTGSLRAPPAISFPLTRAASPAPPPISLVSPLNTSNNQYVPHLDVNGHSRGPSPIPPSPHSPYVMVTPSMTNSPIVEYSDGPNWPPGATTPVASPAQGQVRPRFPPIEGFGPRGNFISPPLTSNSGRLSPNPIRARRLSPLLVPQGALGGDVDPSTLPSPNVLAYYDIPPPSPPPMGPLPSVPPGVGAAAPPPLSHLRAKVHGNELGVPTLGQNIQRGRESPFPARPVVPVPPFPHGQADHMPAPYHVVGGPAARGFDFQRPQKVLRFEDGAPGAFSPLVPPVSRRPMENDMPINVNGHWEHERYNVAPYNGRPSDDTFDSDEDDVEDIRGVLERYTDSSREGSLEDDHIRGTGAGRPLPARHSFEAQSEDVKHESFAVSEYYGGERDTVYGWEGELAASEGRNNRESRWSGSIYSRASIMEPDQSGQARDRFVQRVEAMMKAGEVPPVPAIPEGLANAGSWNKF